MVGCGGVGAEVGTTLPSTDRVGSMVTMVAGVGCGVAIVTSPPAVHIVSWIGLHGLETRDPEGHVLHRLHDFEFGMLEKVPNLQGSQPYG